MLCYVMLSVHPGVKAELMDPYGNQRRVRTRCFDRFVMRFGDTFSKQTSKQAIPKVEAGEQAGKQASKRASYIHYFDRLFMCFGDTIFASKRASID